MRELDNARLKLKNLSFFEPQELKGVGLISDNTNKTIPLSLFWDKDTFPGMKLKHIPEYKEGTMFLCVVEEDMETGEHEHLESEEIQVISGNLTNLTTNNKNSYFLIPANTRHNFKISKGSIFIVIFKPALLG